MIDQWIEQLGSDSQIERLSAENALIVAGNESESALINALASMNDERRWRAAAALFGIEAHNATDTLIPLLTDPFLSVRQWSVCALGMSADPRAYDPLADVAFSVGLDEGAQYMAALGLLKINRERTLAILQEAVTHKEEQVRRVALSALSIDRWNTDSSHLF